MASAIAMTDVWCEPNPNSNERGGYDPKKGDLPLSLDSHGCPCDDCPMRDRCRTEELACQVFDDYVNPWRAKDRPLKVVAKKIPGKAFLKDR